MEKPSLYTTPFGKALYLEKHHIPSAIKFLAGHGRMVTVTPADATKLFLTKPITLSPMYSLVRHLVETNKTSMYTLFDFGDFTKTDIPEVFTMEEITIDGGCVPQDISSIVPSDYRSIWVNLTPILKKRSAKIEPLTLSDSGKFHSLIVRGALCRSYDQTTDAWLTPALSVYIIEAYSMISKLIGRVNSLAPEQTRLVKLLLAMFYAQLLGGPKDQLRIPPLLHGCTRTLGNINDLKELIASMDKLRPNNGESMLSLELIVAILGIHDLTATRMRNFTVQALYRLVQGAIDSQSMMIAMNYPPYFVHMMLKAASGFKHHVMNSIFPDNRAKKELVGFCVELDRTPKFIKGLKHE